MIIFAHHAKTGGSTLIKAFEVTYGRENVYFDEDARLLRNKKWLIRKYFNVKHRFSRREERAGYKVIHGHMSPDKYRRAFPGAFFITLYRHPVEQLLSHYHYWLRSPHLIHTHPLCAWLHEGRPSAEEFAERFITKRIIKKRLKGFDPDRFDFVGITERLDDSMQLLQSRLPELSMSVAPQRVNPEKRMDERYEVDEEGRSRIMNLVEPLILSYEKALARFEREWAASRHAMESDR